MDLSIVIINHNTKALTNQTINSVLNGTDGLDYEIIVVDNSDKSDEFYFSDRDNIKVISGVENKGFGNACNIGASKAKGEYLLFLNSDTIVENEAIYKSLIYLKSNKDIGILGIKTFLEDGTFDNGCKRGFPTPMTALYYFLGFDKKHPENRKYGAYHQTFIDNNKTSEVDAVSGAFMIIKKQLYDELGGFDEAFFMYGEDLDICYRAKEKGYKVVYFADAFITHLKGQSGLHKKSKNVIYHFHKSMQIFYDKHYKKNYNVFTNLAVFIGIKLKYLLTLLKSKIF